MTPELVFQPLHTCTCTHICAHALTYMHSHTGTDICIHTRKKKAKQKSKLKTALGFIFANASLTALWEQDPLYGFDSLCTISLWSPHEDGFDWLGLVPGSHADCCNTVVLRGSISFICLPDAIRNEGRGRIALFSCVCSHVGVYKCDCRHLCVCTDVFVGAYVSMYVSMCCV